MKFTAHAMTIVGFFMQLSDMGKIYTYICETVCITNTF